MDSPQLLARAAAGLAEHGPSTLQLQAQFHELQWRLELHAKIGAILSTLQAKFASAHNICLCQTWLGADGSEQPANQGSLEVTLWADPRLGVVLDPLFAELRVKSCQGPVFFRNSMPGKVWRSGAVQIVQNLRILPPTLHPRSQLSEAALERLAEALYIPIYDLSRPAVGQVCVLEVLLSTRATEAMLVADVISYIGGLLTALHLSLANPVPQPVRRSVLCGRRARAADSDDEGGGGGGSGEGPGGAAAARVRHAEQQEREQAAGGQQAGQQPEGDAPQRQEERGGGACCGAAAAEAEQATSRGAEGARCRTGAAAGQEGPQAAAAAGRPAGGPGGGDPRAGRTGQALPAASEQPTLPASPERISQGGDGARAAAAAAAPACSGPSYGTLQDGTAGAGCAVPRKVRKVLDGPMQRCKSVVSVAALSDGLEAEEEEE